MTAARMLNLNPEIYLDIDGVLADFVGPALAIHNRLELVERWPKGQFSIEAASGIPREQFWEPIDGLGALFWVALPEQPDARNLVEILSRLGPPITLASIPSAKPSCWSGKAAWVAHHFPQFELVLSRNKALLSAPHRILIDDSPANCEAWEALGGYAILYPCEWNKAYAHINHRIPYTVDLVKLALFEIERRAQAAATKDAPTPAGGLWNACHFPSAN